METPSLNEHQKAIAILQHTNDGDALSAADLALLETVVNFGLAALTETGVKHWNSIYEQAIQGQYRRPWLCGQENLTKDPSGRVFWRGIEIEHYSFTDAAAEAAAATELARVCTAVEQRGLPVNWASVSQIYDDAYYGQGLIAPRFHVFWFFDAASDTQRQREQVRCNFAIHPETSVDSRQANAHQNRIAADLNANWQCGANALRYSRVVSRESFAQAQQWMHESARWARTVLHADTQQTVLMLDRFTREMASLLEQRPLMPQSVLSEHVLAAATTGERMANHLPQATAG